MKSCFLFIVVLLLSACANQNTLQSISENNEFSKITLRSALFTHVVLVNQQYYSNAHSMLYVFLEGDGMPWKSKTQISNNPQAVYPLALDLMSKNNRPSVYLQRPCYGVIDQKCQHKWWTNQRYSKPVIDSMVQVLRDLSEDYKEITLVGYSGGGALAVLMARDLNKVTRLITLAGNLDHQQWTQHHVYSSLQGSLNPVDFVLPSDIRQFHFAGQEDKNILPNWIKVFSNKQKNSQFILIKDIDHRCCWVKKWPEIIKQVEQRDNE